MHVRVSQRIDDVPEAATTYGACYRFYDIYEFDFGDGRIVHAECEMDRNLVQISGLTDAAGPSSMGQFYDAQEAALVVAELRQRGLSNIQVRVADAWQPLDDARLKGAP